MDETEPTITERVVWAVAAETGRDPLELPPLYEAIDPDALDTAFRTLDTGEIAFRYADSDVTVRADQSVEVATAAGSDANTWTESQAGD
jgi:hypothetical protein